MLFVVQVDGTVPPDDSGQVALGHQVKDPGAADAPGFSPAYRFQMKFTIRIDLQVPDGALLCPHTVAAAEPFQRRTGGTGTHEQVILTAKAQFSIGADVQENRRRIGGIQVRQQQSRGNVSAKIVGNCRETVYIAV